MPASGDTGPVTDSTPRRLRSGAAGRPADAWLVLGLVAVTGNPVLSNPLVAPVLYVVLVVLALALGSGATSRRFAHHFAWLAAGFGTVFVAQAQIFGLVSWPGSAHFLVKMLVGGWLIDRLGLRFIGRYFEATYWLCASSLVCYAVLLALGPQAFPSLFDAELTGSEDIKSIGFFTVHNTPEWWRNSSMLWEPGAFQGIINLALFLMPARLLWQRRNRFKLLVLLLALISTFSTTGYLVLFLVALYKLGSEVMGRFVRLSGLAALTLAAGFTISEADFLGEKVVQQFIDAQSYEGFMPDRFGAFLFDLQYIEKSPIFGNGLIEETRYADHPQLQGLTLGHGNGLSNFLASFGFAGLLIYLAGILRSGFGRPGSSIGPRITLALVVAALSFGEQFLNTPLFLGLPFLMLAAVPRRAGRRRRRAVLQGPLAAKRGPVLARPA